MEVMPCQCLQFYYKTLLTNMLEVTDMLALCRSVVHGKPLTR